MSRAMAMAIFWKFSAWASALVSKFIWVSLLTPSTSSATVSPNWATRASLNAGILDDIVQHRCHQALMVHVHVGEDIGYREDG